MADKERINPSYLSRTIRLSLLAPDIVETILNGTQRYSLQTSMGRSRSIGSNLASVLVRRQRRHFDVVAEVAKGPSHLLEGEGEREETLHRLIG